MPDIRLIASDMDGTLLDAQGRISPRTLSALKKAQEKGVIFTMCTGRFHTHCCALARDVGLNCSIIASNGGSVFDGISQRMVGEHLLDATSARMAQEIAERYPIQYRITMPGAFMDRHEANGDGGGYFQQITQVMLRDYHVQHICGAENIRAMLDQPVYKVFLFKFPDQEMRERARAELQQVPGAYITTSGGLNLEVMPQGVDKGTGLAELAAFYGIPLENVMVFGDYDNDLPMFRRAGYPVAMGNATDEIKRHAWQVTAPNTEDGLAQAIEKYVLSV